MFLKRNTHIKIGRCCLLVIAALALSMHANAAGKEKLSNATTQSVSQVAEVAVKASGGHVGTPDPIPFGVPRRAPPYLRTTFDWLLAHIPVGESPLVTQTFMLAHTKIAFEAWTTAPWADLISEDIFREAILPYASISETRELWIADMRAACLPLVAHATSPAQAAVILNQTVFNHFNVHYSTLRERADQSPSESIKSGLASCSGLSIFLVDACRSVGVPARMVGVPMWMDGSGNHSWVEIWDGVAWRYTGADEPIGDQLDIGWFSDRASHQSNANPENAIYSITWRNTGILFPLVYDATRASAWCVDVTDRYTAVSNPLGPNELLVRVVVRQQAGSAREISAVQAVVDNLIGASGNSKDERSDLNDSLELIVPKDRFNAGDVSWLIDGFAPAAIDQHVLPDASINMTLVKQLGG